MTILLLTAQQKTLTHIIVLLTRRPILTVTLGMFFAFLRFALMQNNTLLNFHGIKNMFVLTKKTRNTLNKLNLITYPNKPENKRPKKQIYTNSYIIQL